MGIRDAIGDRWARFRAYLHSIPPHVWLGLVIGAIALVLAYLAWKHKNDPLSPLSQVTPLDTTTTTTTPGSLPSVNQIPLPSVPDLGNLVYPPGQYYNFSTGHPVTPVTVTPGAPAFNRQIGYDIHAASQAASLLQSASAPAHSFDIHAASQANAAKAAAASLAQSASAPIHSYDIHAASQAASAKSIAQSASAPAHGYDIHAASQAITNATHAVVSGAKVPLPPTQRGTNISFGFGS